MEINIFETSIVPSVDLDEDVAIYVPGYATQGPGDPTYVTSQNFTALFGSTPYKFKNNQVLGKNDKNNAVKGSPEKSWVLAKKLVDAGLTVLFHRQHQKAADGTYLAPTAETEPGVFKFQVQGTSGYTDVLIDKAPVVFKARAKYFGSSYNGINVEISPVSNGVSTVTVKRGNTVLESVTVSGDPTNVNFIGVYEFANIEFYVSTDEEGNDLTLNDLGLSEWLSENGNPFLYCSGSGTLAAEVPTETVTIDGEEVTRTADEFTVSQIIADMSADASIFDVLKDYDQYAVTYITPGGYFDNTSIAGNMMTVGYLVKAVALTAQTDTVADLNGFTALQGTLAKITTADTLTKSEGAMFLGCDTFTYGTQRIILPDWAGYLIRLGANIGNGVPAWVPVANNSNGTVSSGIAATRPISKELSDNMTSAIGISVNPIVYKRNVGYVIMGNRTTYPNDGILHAESFLNCRLVINSVERSARASSARLAIVSTNRNATFKEFRNDVSKTCDKMLVNGDGLNSYDIQLLPKTKPATIDVAVNLVVVEGIETFNLNFIYSIATE